MEPEMNPASPLRFTLGRVVATLGADALLRRHKIAPVRLLARHLAGDWGDLPPEDVQANEAALLSGARLLSAYTLPDGETVWIITEAEPRAVTTFLTPREY